MMEYLPSYHEATTRPDWLHLVAPFVAPRDYPALCRVNGRFWHVFAPRLWSDLLLAVRHAGLQSGDDVGWWLDFALHRLQHVARDTRSLVHVLDAREFAKDSYHFASDDQSLNQSFKWALASLPNLTCILLDGHTDLDPGALLTGGGTSTNDHRLLLLSMARCTSPMPSTFFRSPSLAGVVYLDVSGIPGAIWHMLQASFLPELRILKVRNRRLDDTALSALIGRFGKQLWSLDICGNRATDVIIGRLAADCFWKPPLWSYANFRIDGGIDLTGEGTPDYGKFAFVKESEWSGSFSHPERYLIDSPMYTAKLESGPQEYQVPRADGQRGVKSDSVQDVQRAFCGQDRRLSVVDYRHSQDLTHLHLSHNQISALGIEMMLRIAAGHLEELSCDSMPLVIPQKEHQRVWPKSAMLYGIPNAAHFLRPVFSSNLRTLRIHHSVVTQIPTLQMEGVSKLKRLHIAETSILSRVQQAYAQAFVPDMNPRLTSLTLTRIPRHSSGPLIAKLVQFLKLLSIQERVIHDTRTAWSSRRAPGILEGLKHLRLQFESISAEESLDLAEDLDAEELMRTGDVGFSFFEDERAASRRTLRASTWLPEPTRVTSSTSLHHNDDGEFLTHRGNWNGESFAVPVWIGNPGTDTNPVIKEYRRLVMNLDILGGVGPATAGQVMAGAPKKSFIFQTAWSMAIMPKELPSPTRDELAAMKDVLDEIKQFRLKAKAKYMGLKQQATGGIQVPPGEPHFFWTGSLQVCV
ncbi:hypothetical protein EDB81DRAFT_931451 [Dactylonectria macrodidyma]|uniref:Leucine rich repeat domain containing protein n=1 Tax=Dactylonectria macrodidyma TaxID=307937 RepID=A0A9P9F3Q3_9HYPO|nr:hypothetical protein EDB81DRAFT_931451 [Dactylonectria macrodidyma]